MSLQWQRTGIGRIIENPENANICTQGHSVDKSTKFQHFDNTEPVGFWYTWKHTNSDDSAKSCTGCTATRISKWISTSNVDIDDSIVKLTSQMKKNFFTAKADFDT